MDAANRRPQLPALTYLDIGKVKREEEAYQNRNTTGSGTPHSLSTSAGASPTYHYPPGPPPPYTHTHGHPPPPPPPPTQANTWSGASMTANTPPESRRTSEHDKVARQSLPSISEALGVDSQATFASTPSQAPPPLQSAHLARPKSTAPASPPSAGTRTYPMDPPHASPSSYATNNSSYPSHSQYRADSAYQPSYPSADASRSAAYPPAPETKPTYPPQAARAPQSTGFPRPAEQPAAFGSPPSQANGSMPPPANIPYGYTPYPPRYANPPPPASTSAGPIYQPSTVYASQQPQAAPGWKSEGGNRFDDRQPGQAAYGDNVKRHLDFYDLENALNEIASTSGILIDFSRRYGDRMHQTQRSGPTISTLPGIVEVDDMVSKTRVQLDSLLKIRDVILAQQAVYEQQAADQRQHSKIFPDQAPPPPHPDMQMQQSNGQGGRPHDFDDGNGYGMDTKKRRGRAAPPGRCHSCNRAETPEWRRGPDGARTLCNACGLHYAKLTRKNQGTNKGSAVGSSNLRPKENMG